MFVTIPAPTTELLRAAAGGPLAGTAAVPGDKSISHRALILAALAEGESRIAGLLESADVLATAVAIRAFGAEAERHGPGSWTVRGGRWRSPAGPVDCGNSGTAARLLMGAAAGAGVRATFDGDASLRARPMARVTGPLAAMGARIEGGPALPLTVEGGGLGGIGFVNERASAQVKSAILFAGLGTDAPVEIVEPIPSRDHGERLLRAFGADVAVEGGTIRLGPRRTLRATEVTVPADPSSAAFPLVAALLVPASQVTVPGMLANPLRTGLYDTLAEMGADLSFANRRMVGGEEVADVTARHSRLRGVTVPAGRAPRMIDEYPVLAVAAAFAEGRTEMHGLAELRVKESDRLAAIVSGLHACCVDAQAAGDSLTVAGGTVPGGASIASRGDHRIAMAFLVLGLAAPAPVEVDEVGMIATSFPGFAGLMRGLGAGIEPR